MIVTLSNQYGAGAISIGKLVAGTLGYEFVDQQLPVVVAKRMRITPEEVEATEDAGRSLGERLLSGFEVSTPELGAPNFGETFDEACLREVQNAVREYAAHGEVVLVGRGAGVILGRRHDVLRLYLHAPREWRMERIAQDLGIEHKTALAEIDRVDRARRAYLRDWYGAEFGDPAICDLAIDTSTFGVEHSAALIVAAVRERE